MVISIIVAVADNGVIGTKDAMLPWKQSADLKRYRSITTGHPIIMGRKTYETINRPLPNRTNIIVTSNEDYQAEGCVVVDSLDAAFDAARQAEGSDEAFVIGGGMLYEAALPLVDKLYITEIHARPAGDTSFSYDSTAWDTVSREDHPADAKNEYGYSFVNLVRHVAA